MHVFGEFLLHDVQYLKSIHNNTGGSYCIALDDLYTFAVIAATALKYKKDGI